MMCDLVSNIYTLFMYDFWFTTSLKEPSYISPDPTISFPNRDFFLRTLLLF